MKTSITAFALVVTTTLLIVQCCYQEGFTNVAGAPAGRAGSPFDFGGITCNISGCHNSFPLGSRPGWIISNIPGSGYVAGQTYTITATATSSSSCVRFGFEISPQTATGITAGTAIITNATQTKLALSTSTRWVTHTQTGSSAAATPGTKTWSFNWTAPASGTGTVTFYGAFNRTNNSGNSLGDSIFTSQLVVPENPTAVWEESAQNFSFSVYPVPANESIFIRLKTNNNFLPEIELTDISGKIICKVSDAASSSVSEYTFNLNTRNIDPGVYFIRIIGGSDVAVKKIIIL
jgi:hypothetical protein